MLDILTQENCTKVDNRCGYINKKLCLLDLFNFLYKYTIILKYCNTLTWFLLKCKINKLLSFNVAAHHTIPWKEDVTNINSYYTHLELWILLKFSYISKILYISTYKSIFGSEVSIQWSVTLIWHGLWTVMEQSLQT